MSAPALLSPRNLRSSPRIGAAVLLPNGAPMAPIDLSRAVRASAIAAADACATADQTDHLAYACRRYSGEGLRGRADAVRDHADGMQEAADWCARCAAIPGLPDLVEAIERGAAFWVDAAPVSPGNVVVRPQADPAGPRPGLWSWTQRMARRVFARAA